MKRVFIPLLMASLLFIAHSTFAQCPSVSDRNLILTEGIAEVTGQNDSARISMAILTGGPNLEQVSLDNAIKTKAVLKTIKGLNIENLKLKTSNYRLTPRKDYKARPPEIIGYEVHNTIEGTLEGCEPEHLSKHVSKIVGKALESGANNIHNIQFYIKDKELLEKEALTQATQEAMDRARVLSKAAGVKLKRIASLSTHPIQIPPRPQMFPRTMMATADAQAPPIESGDSQIRVQVTVAYEIE